MAENRIQGCWAIGALSALSWSVALASFAAAQPLPPIPGFVRCDIPLVAVPASAITAGDFNQDGNPDLAIVDGTNNQVVVLLTNRERFAAGDCVNATTTNNISVAAGPTSIAVGDLDLNNTLDLVVGVQTGASILRGDGSGGFKVEAPLAAGSDPQAVAISDVDGDGIPDIVVGNGGGSGNGVSIRYGRAGGTYDPAVSLPLDGPVTLMVVQDLNRDSFVDIAAGSRGTGKVTVFIQDRNNPRTFSASPPFSVGVAPTAMVAGDFNGDGAPDLAITFGGTAGELGLFLNQLPGNEAQPFVQGIVVPTGISPSALGADDFNGDFALDVVVANQGDQTLPFFLGDDRGSLTEESGNCRGSEGGRCSVGAGPRGLVLADVDGDGHSDVITANQGARSISVLLSSRPPPTPTSIPTTTPTVTPTRTFTGTTTPTATSTPTPVSTSTATVTRRPTVTPTPTDTPSPTPRCYGSVCVQGQSCAIVAPEQSDRGGFGLLAPTLLWFMYRRWRRK